jgi:peptide/nickel transport system permease protein
MTLLAKLLSRLLLGAVVAWGAASLAWLLTTTLPGDPVEAALGPQAAPADHARARALYGTDRPLSERYVRWHRRLLHRSDSEVPHDHCAELGVGLHSDLGFSFTYRQPVAPLIQKKLPRSLELAVAATALQVLLGVSLGAWAALRRGTRLDAAIVSVSTALGSAPTFALGLLLQYALAHRLGLLPIDTTGQQAGLFSAAIVLPASTIALYGAGALVRVVRRELVDATQAPFFFAARARGATRFGAIVRHALRSALVPISQLAILELGGLIGGAVVTEKLFRWPGLGDLTVAAIQNRDVELVVGLTLVGAFVVTITLLLADVLALLLDPRASARGTP